MINNSWYHIWWWYYMRDVIQRDLQRPDFNGRNNADHNLYERLTSRWGRGYWVIDLWEEGDSDGLQDYTFVKLEMSKALVELLSDERIARHQHLGFKLSSDVKGGGVIPRCIERWWKWIAELWTGPVHVGPGTVPISIIHISSGYGDTIHPRVVCHWCLILSIAEAAERIRSERLSESRIRAAEMRKRHSEAAATARAAEGGSGTDCTIWTLAYDIMYHITIHIIPMIP